MKVLYILLRRRFMADLKEQVEYEVKKQLREAKKLFYEEFQQHNTPPWRELE